MYDYLFCKYLKKILILIILNFYCSTRIAFIDPAILD